MNTPKQIAIDATIHKRPHYRLDGDQLFFLKSKRPMKQLSVQELAVWKALDEDSSINALCSRLNYQADETITEFSESGLCDIVPKFPTERHRIIVFEPHSDDATLSIGGTMWLRRNEVEFTLVTLGSRSNYTSYWFLDRDFFDIEQITNLRNAEASAFMRLLGGKHIAIGYNEATLRYHDANWSLDYFREHRVAVAAFNNHRSTDIELNAWKKAVREILHDSNADEIWMPLGIGTHTDHELARNACLSVLIENTELAKNCTIRLFQDVPYDSNFPAHTMNVINGLKLSGANLVPEPQPIKNVFDKKLNLLSIYASQFKVSVLKNEVEASSRLNAEAAEMVEHFWFLEKPPTTLDALSLYIDKNLVEKTAPKLLNWVRRYQNSKRIRFLMLMPAGRWAEDIQFIMEIFPHASFDVYGSSPVVVELAQFDSPRIQVHHVTSSKIWLLRIIQLALSRFAPTAFIVATARLSQANLLAKLWPLGTPVVVPTMDHFVLALRQAVETNNKNVQAL